MGETETEWVGTEEVCSNETLVLVSLGGVAGTG